MISTESKNTKTSLCFSQIEVNQAYREEWNVRNEDFICLSKNEELIRPTLYRLGGLNRPNLAKDKYFMLIKYTEALYPTKFTKQYKLKSQKHLQSSWCILDEEGNELREFVDSLDYPNIIKNSCIYNINKGYYNIITNELYCKAYNSITSSEYLFLNNEFDEDHSRRGVWKIKLSDGSYERFP